MTTTDDYRECARGARCHHAVSHTGEWRGAPTPRAFCDPCTTDIRRALAGLPLVYRELRDLLGDQPPAGGEKVTVRRVEAPMPLRGDVEALCAEIEHTVEAWGDRVRELLGLPPKPVRDVAWARRADAVERACTLLSHRVTALIGLPMGWMRLPDGSHDERGGADAGLDLLDVHHRADRVAAPTRPTFTIPGVVCPQCSWPALLRRDGQDHARCPACGDVVAEREYQQLMRDALLSEGLMS